MLLKSNIKFIFLLLMLSCQGCTVFYTSLHSSTESTAKNLPLGKDCEIKFSIEIIETKYSGLNKIDEFKRFPYVDDYIKWTKSTISEIGCRPTFTDIGADLKLKITDDFVYGQGAGQGVGILALLSLYIVPIPWEYPHRSYEISSGDTVKNITVKEKGWTGWIFLPAHPFSYLPYEKDIFISQLKNYLIGEKT
jgi:hypothetical protein